MNTLIDDRLLNFISIFLCILSTDSQNNNHQVLNFSPFYLLQELSRPIFRKFTYKRSQTSHQRRRILLLIALNLHVQMQDGLDNAIEDHIDILAIVFD